MIEIEEELLDAYAEELSIASIGFEMMGKLLNVKYIKERIKLLNITEMYIYGGGYLGIQLYYATSKLVYVPAVIDRENELSIKTLDIPVMGIEELKRIYKEEKIIIASLKFYREIQKDLSNFVPQNQIMFLGEFLGGIV